MKLITKITSSFQHKCPQCLEGDMFIDRNPYHLKNMSKMYSHCPNCGLNFEPEPGYYYGAMYVSYAFTIAVSVAVFLFYWVLFSEFDTLTFIIANTVVLIFLAPYTFRTARAVWLNLFVKYDARLKKKSI
ncbi:MAG: DUF983 domain-containing protein [Bacteroidia bacterium]|jgi:uncharacterized protein (DUF983 family)|nr:DUF983 domain-containing protein [Bacteroidia bacterium]MBP7243848.1 DUF983 domain-containing protein [Bacteroidia bacterium]